MYVYFRDGSLHVLIFVWYCIMYMNAYMCMCMYTYVCIFIFKYMICKLV